MCSDLPIWLGHSAHLLISLNDRMRGLNKRMLAGLGNLLIWLGNLLIWAWKPPHLESADTSLSLSLSLILIRVVCFLPGKRKTDNPSLSSFLLSFSFLLLSPLCPFPFLSHYISLSPLVRVFRSGVVIIISIPYIFSLLFYQLPCNLDETLNFLEKSPRFRVSS